MTIRHLKVFISVCENNSMTKAAEELFIAQPAVSKTISEIETHYNIILFERINKRLYLTEEGSQLLIKAKEIINSFCEFEDLAHNSSIKPTVKIGSSITIGKQQMPHLLRGLNDLFPQVTFQLSVNQTSVIENKILDGSLDFAFIQGKPSSSDIKAKLVDKNHLVAVCGNGYDIPSSLTLKELCKYDLLLREDDSVSREFLDHTFALENIVVKPVIESVSNQALISAASENLGVTILPESLLRRQLKSGKLKKIEITDHEFTRNSYLIYHKSKTFNDTKKAIFDYSLKNYIK